MVVLEGGINCQSCEPPVLPEIARRLHLRERVRLQLSVDADDLDLTAELLPEEHSPVRRRGHDSGVVRLNNFL